MRAIVLALLLFASSTFAQQVDGSQSRITFGFKQENVPGEGAFRRFSAQVTFDPAHPEMTRALIDVDVSSIDLGDQGWNRDIASSAWLGAEKFPKATFSATGARSVGGDRYEAPGKFSLKGTTRDVTATFTAKQAPGGTVLEGIVPLKRSDFRVGDGAWADTTVVADEVAVRFVVFLKKQP